MKKRLLAGLTALTLLLTGCSSMLEREYGYVTEHDTNPASDGDPSTLRAESYQELVNILIYFINQGAESGSIRLYSDSEDAEADLEAACLEVVQEDPLGAYAVEYIKYSINSIVTYYEADVQITYRRTMEQISSIVSATGTTAIRSELENALADFAAERVLRIGAFDGDEDYIRTLFQEAYYANPAVALGMPEIAISIYPDTGRQRIVEITLTYPLELTELERRRALLDEAVQELVRDLWGEEGDALILAAAQAVLDAGGYDPKAGSTAYDALLTGGADSEGLSLATALLFGELDVECRIIPGTWEDSPHTWLLVSTQEGWMHLDPARLSGAEEAFRSDGQMLEDGFAWDTQSFPPSGPGQA